MEEFRAVCKSVDCSGRKSIQTGENNPVGQSTDLLITTTTSSNIRDIYLFILLYLICNHSYLLIIIIHITTVI